MKKATLIALLVSIGVSKANADKIAANTPDDGTDALTEPEITTLVNEWKEQQKALIKNDSSVVDEIRNAEKAKNLEQVERKLKQTFGLTASDVEGKKWDEIIVLAKSKAGDGKTSDSKDLQEKILALENEKKNLLEVEIPAAKEAAANHIKKFETERKFLSSIPTKDKEGKDMLRLPVDTVTRLLKMDMDEKYDVSLDDKGEWVIKEKGTEFLAKSADKTKFLTMDDFIATGLEKHGAIVKSNGKPNEKKTEKITPEGGDAKPVSPALKKAQAHEEALKSEGVE